MADVLNFPLIGAGNGVVSYLLEKDHNKLRIYYNKNQNFCRETDLYNVSIKSDH